MQKSWKNCTVKSHTYLPPRFYSYRSIIFVLLSNLLILFLNPSHLFLKNEFQGKSETSVHFISQYSSKYNISLEFSIHLTISLRWKVVLVVKNPPANAGDIRDASSVSGSGRSPGGGHGNSLQHSCLVNPQWTEEPGRSHKELGMTEVTVHACIVCTNLKCF